MDLNIDFVRQQFPSLSSDWIFMDNAGGSQTVQPVIDRINEFYLTSDVQLGATYEPSRIATERVASATAKMAEFINAAHTSEVILGSSTTMLLRILSICLSRNFKPGDEIIVTDCDHEANIGCWMDLQKMGINIKTWKINQNTFDLQIEDLKNLLNDKTRLVALTHTSNILGTINPIREIAFVVHKNGALICVDGVAYAPHRQIDVQVLDVDFYTLSFYKVYGPHYALLYGKRYLLEKMNGINHFFLDQEIPYKFQPGNVNYEITYGLLGVPDYFEKIASKFGDDLNTDQLQHQVSFIYKIIAKHEQSLSTLLLDYLNSKSQVKIIGKTTSDREERVPTISFVAENKNSNEITLEADKYKIGIRYGDFYARRLIDNLGLSKKNGVVRVSLVHYNTHEEVNKLIDVFEKIL